jgi:hypothetical protein
MMITTYLIPCWVTWTTFRSQPAATHWTGQGTLDDPWIIAPADDVWSWFVQETPRHLHLHTVSLMFEYTLGEEGLRTTMTVTAESASVPVPSPA